MKKTTLAAIVALPVLGMGILGISTVSASQGLFGFGHLNHRTPTEIAASQSEMFQYEATILGISIDEVKDAWAAGKDMKQIIEEKGLDADAIEQRVKAEREAQMTEEVQVLVSQGIITQAQADTRLETLKNQPAHEGGMRALGKGMGGKREMRGRPAPAPETTTTQS